MTDMRKLMAIVADAGTPTTAKLKQKNKINESCSKHTSNSCACDSYLCESCYPEKKYKTVVDDDAPTVARSNPEPKMTSDNDDGQSSPMTQTSEISEDESQFSVDSYVNSAQANTESSQEEFESSIKYSDVNDDAYPVLVYMINGSPVGWFDAENMQGHRAEFHDEFANKNDPNMIDISQEEFESNIDFDGVDDSGAPVMKYIKDGEVIAYYDDENMFGYAPVTNEGINRMRELAGIQEDEEEFETGDSSDEFAAPEKVVDLGDEEPEDAEFSSNQLNTLDKDAGNAIQGFAPDDVDDLMSEIMNMQALGMSNARTEYSDDMLVNMSPERIKKVYSAVMGESEQNSQSVVEDSAVYDGEADVFASSQDGAEREITVQYSFNQETNEITFPHDIESDAAEEGIYMDIEDIKDQIRDDISFRKEPMEDWHGSEELDEEGFADTVKRKAKRAGRQFSKAMWWDGYMTPAEIQAKVVARSDDELLYVIQQSEEEPDDFVHPETKLTLKLVMRELKKRNGVSPRGNEHSNMHEEIGEQSDFVIRVKELAQTTTNVDVIAKHLGTSTEKVRKALSEAAESEIELTRIKKLVRY